MEVHLRLMGFLQLLLCWITAPLYYLLTLRRHKPLRPIQSQILLQSATELARKIRTQEYTSEQVVRAFMIRCKVVNPSLNAIVEDCFADALKEAHTVDQFILSGVKSLEDMAKDTPFLGVPFTVKESLSVEGKSKSVGCLPRVGIKNTSDPEAVSNLRKAGAIPLAVTNTPELCFCWESNNLVTGCTNNPYDFNRTPSGSSGGDAALLSSGASVIAVGSDIAGSIRIPAAFTGLFGHKPSPGYISIEGHYPNLNDEKFERFLTVGPLTRYAEDLKPLFKVLAGNKCDLLNLDEEINLKKLRIMYSFELAESLVAVQTDEEVKLAVEKVAIHFNRKFGCPTTKTCIEELSDALEISLTELFSIEGIPNLLDESKSADPKVKKSLLTEIIKAIFGLSEFSLRALIFSIIIKYKGFIPQSKQKKYQEMLKTLKAKFCDMLGDDGVFIIPTFPIPAFYHGQYLMKTAGVTNTIIFNALEMPATHVPLFLSKDGLPIGVQVVAAPNQDRLCFAVAEELGDVFGGWVPPC